MLTEIVVFLSVLLFIAVLFYKQANEQFEILQIEASRISELPTMYQDRSPIVVSDYDTPHLGTKEELYKRHSIIQMATAPGQTLGQLLANPRALIPIKTAEFLAKETGLQIWFEHHLAKMLLPSYTSFLYSFNTSLWPHKRGMFKTKAFQTFLMPTQGTAVVTLMLQKMIPYLPTKWYSREFASLSLHDTPLLNQIQFIDIKLRRGNLLLLPAHLIVDVKSDNDGSDAWVFMAEIHHPISRFIRDT
jgi:hypothetical protein